jgi:N-acetylmuramoyl-L-alanine amidase
MRIAFALLVGLAVAGRPDAAPPVPATVVVATSRGEMAIAVRNDAGHAALPVPELARLLPVVSEIVEGWALVAFAWEPFRFLLGAPAMVHRDQVHPLAGGAYVRRDTLFVPLQWLTTDVPRVFSEGYRYDPAAARFEERAAVRTTAAPPAPTGVAPPAGYREGSAAARANGLQLAHRVVVDPGHGGTDPGNPGRYLPVGVKEKHVTLAIGKYVRDELRDRGVDVVMTRTTDTLIALAERAPMCRADCDLFVSIHVNSLPRRAGYERVSGVETYFLGDALTEEARRVAAMEDEALRYEIAGPRAGDIGFIFRDLQTNEFLRESALLADLVQDRSALVHPGRDRGVAQARFTVLATATRPAVLVETGFATNREDGRFLASVEGQRRIARAIAEGVVDYLKRYEGKILAGSQP